MNLQAFYRAILDDPDDTTTRLVFADWLEENGQPERAEWLRLSCQLVGLSHRDEGWADLYRRQLECWKRCKPEWWEDTSGIYQQDDRGLFRLVIGSKTASNRLGKLPWLGEAVAGGWIEGVGITWSDGEMAKAVGKWKGAARELPLHLKVAPQISDEGLAVYSGVPNLWSLNIPNHAFRNPAAMKLLARPDLRNLTLDHLPGGDQRGTILEVVGRSTALREVTLKDHRLVDAELAALAGLQSLRSLHLECESLTDACVGSLSRLPALRRLELWGCRGITDEGAQSIRQALPAVRIERL